MVSGCAALLGSDAPSAGFQYDLVGRMRIQADETILRLDFYLAYDGTVTNVEFWGPFGLGRTKLSLSEGHYAKMDAEGRLIEISPQDLAFHMPTSLWQVGGDLGRWLLLQPLGATSPKALEGWSYDDIDVQVEAHQTIADEAVCKRLRVASEDIEVLVLCDRWRIAPN
ncbi:MAG: hypothetical protein F4W90_08325 [Gammaproteobacteria bacterium]|nr:hypothetical protein [Gammaproteobacteria bacterium]